MSVKAKPAEVASVAETAAASVSKGIDATVSSLKDSMKQAAAGFESTQEQVKEGMEKAMKTGEEMVAFGQGNVEAYMKSGQILVAGLQDLTKQMTATAQASFDESVSTFKALSGMKSLKDAMDLQTSYARASFEKAMTESSKMTDASFKLTEQAMAPLTARVTAAMEKFVKAV